MKRLLSLVFALLVGGVASAQVVTSETTTVTTRTYEAPTTAVVESPAVVTAPTVISSPPVIVAPSPFLVAPYRSVRIGPRRPFGVAFPGYAVYPW